MKKPVVLMIMDGFGLNPDAYGNAIKAAKTPQPDPSVCGESLH